MVIVMITSSSNVALHSLVAHNILEEAAAFIFMAEK
jgi:hypothetical protein